MDGRRLEEIIDDCVQRLLQGEVLDDVLLRYPGMGAQLLPALKPALALVQAPVMEPAPLASNAAMNAMLREVREAAARPAPAGVFAWLGSLRARPLAFQALAVAGAIVLFGGLGIGASAATGTAPEPVRSFLRISSESESKVQLNGTIVSVGDGSLVIQTESGERTILLTMSTLFQRDAARIDAADLNVGEDVRVIGTQRRDGGVSAREVHAKAAPAPTATPSAVAPALPAVAGTPEGEPWANPQRSDEHRDDGHREGEPTQATATQQPEDRREDGGDHPATPSRDSTPESGFPPRSDDPGETRTPEPEDKPKTPEPVETHVAEPTESSSRSVPTPSGGSPD